MPKQIYKIDQFHGGLNTNSDPRDIADNELSSLKSAVVDEIGIIRAMGGTGEYPDTIGGRATSNLNPPVSSNITPGYGLFQWNHDRVDGHTVSAGSNDAETGANYLAFSDTDDHSSGKLVRIYSLEDDTWGAPITGLNDNTGGNRKDVFYSVDGALRVCDSLFANTNTNKWYGYVDKEFMYNSGSTVSVDQWISKSQYITKPGANSGWDDAISASATSAAHTHTASGAGSDGIGALLTSDGTQTYFQAENVLNDGAGDAVSNIYTMDITVRVQYDNISDSDWAYTLTAGDASDSTTFVANPSSKSTGYVGDGTVDDTDVIEDRVHTFTFAVGDTVQGTGSTAGVRATLVVPILGGDVDSIGIIKVVTTEGSTSGASHDGVDGNDIDTNEVFIESAFETTTDAIGWDKKWEHGFSFIYDEKQESLVRRIEKVDPSSGATSPPTYEQAVTDAAHAPSVKLSIPYASNWNPRITGAVWYIRDVSGAVPSHWLGQIECNFIQGTGKILSSGKEFDCTFNPTTSEYNFDVDHENLLQPNQTDTYFSRTGVLEDTESISSRFKSAVTVGRRVYIGNVQIIKDDGSKEIKGDAMLKSPVNRFDTFPSSSIVEAAVNDGESIVALQEFADRILQFKQQTLYIINVSQDIEFLEDVYKYKGVLHPASVCKTDYGIAWANILGCYLYDGKQVINLLEKGGRRIISESDWSDFLVADKSAGGNDTALIPMVGYFPHKRQIIIFDDITNNSTAEPRMYLYDMVTQSWAKGSDDGSNRQIDIIKTNFVNDWDGNLIYGHTAARICRWSNTPQSSGEYEVITKDIDFGEPGRRKKIYKVLVTYDSNNANPTQIQVDYDVDGGTTFPYDFKAGTQFTYPDELDPADGWKVAELVPDTSSEANNIKSFRLRFKTDANSPARFKINDISIIYRMKPPK